MNPILRKLMDAGARPERVILGLISGTSADSIAVAICRIRGGGVPGPGRTGAAVELIHEHDHPYDPHVKLQVLRAGDLKTREVAELNVRVGELFAEACLAAIAAAGLSPNDVDLIGSHGQTLYHHSSIPGAPRATLQVGDGDEIAERTGITVVSDFRTRDVAAGGEGAPLTAFTDTILFAPRDGETTRRVILNLGGIANVTILDSDPEHVYGFDTGPANALLDRLAIRISGGALACDLDGRIARSGTIREPLLESLLRDDPFLSRKPPKSTGFEMYGDAFLDRAIALHGHADADLMATLTEFTARTITLALRQFTPAGGVDELVVAGGGVRNPALLDRIKSNAFPIRVRLSDELGVPISAREAMGFAVLAHEALLGHPTSLPSVTGARRAATLGKWSYASS
ncbi:anhydro-N-acetylmuramic acid kinase [Singulisphaera sp. PoT]|uniref:anhydro-N-acetylmuramic acid kinase n=1 Tax=Singulisphaera sp. PoT TaxID=3411797 RepID=UPI003BF46CCC